MRSIPVAIIALFACAAPAAAHPEGHDEERRIAERRPVAELAQDAIVKLVAQAKLPASWAKAKAIKTDVRTRNGAQQMVVTFQNKAERRTSKRLLYVLMTTDGTFISANHRLS